MTATRQPPSPRTECSRCKKEKPLDCSGQCVDCILEEMITK